MQDIDESLDLDADILQFYDRPLAPSKTKVVEVQSFRVDEVEASQSIAKKPLLEVGRNEVGHFEAAGEGRAFQ